MTYDTEANQLILLGPKNAQPYAEIGTKLGWSVRQTRRRAAQLLHRIGCRNRVHAWASTNGFRPSRAQLETISQFYSLSHRERQIFHLLIGRSDLSRQAIAEHLSIHEAPARSHAH